MLTSDWIRLAIATIALLALLRPEIEGLFHRWVGRLNVYAGPTVELGFSRVGHTVAIEGSLRARRSNYFVVSSSILVRRENGEEFELLWSGFRPRRTVATVGQAPYAILSPAPIEVKSGSSHLFHIIYSDSATRERVEATLLPLSQELIHRLRDKSVVPLPDPAAEPAIVAEQKAFLTDLQAAGRFEILAQSLRNQLFWRQGQYSFEVSFLASAPDRKSVFTGSFRLTQTQAESLQGNAATLLYQNAGELNSVSLSFVSVDLVPALNRGSSRAPR